MMPAKTSHKHSFSVPSTPANTRSHTTSLAVTNSAKSDRGIAPPVTPKRIPRAHKYHMDSPFTPVSSFSTPYTPLSFRSVLSSNDSTLNTPGSAPRAKRLSFSMSSEVDLKTKDKSLADIAQNWRSRANENGIKVSSAPDGSHYANDESFSSQTPSKSNSLESVTTEEVLLPPFLSSHRRARAQSYAVPPAAPISPQVLRTPARKALAVLNTPPPKPSYAQQLKLKGSLTDPPHTRRRPPFGHPTTQLSNIDENEYIPYPQVLYSPESPAGISFSFNDPFQNPVLSTITETEPHHFPSNLQYQSHMHFHSVPPQNPPKIDISSCSVCGRSSGALAILEPCMHPLCSACLTSALNIVGEKDMECAVCKVAVADFHLKAQPPRSMQTATMTSPHVGYNTPTNMVGKAFIDPLITTTTVRSQTGLLPSALDDAFLDQGAFFEGARGASTPVLERETSPKTKENVVLRIDNVPWDITPPAIIAWLKQPVVCVHVLLDRKGKTLSHAFVEVANEEVARAALRSAQNSVLGKGKRARGVTVTRSGQEELMQALFPSWKGHFDGSRPSLAGLDNEHVISTFETGLMPNEELTSLLHLIRSPDSHFLKVPSLPFHSLISILSKFPADIDSRVFWSGSLRDTLYDTTLTAVKILLSRITANDGSGDLELLSNLVGAGLKCQAFTSQQIKGLTELDSASLTSIGTEAEVSPTPLLPNAVNDVKSVDNDLDLQQGTFGALAREFGVEKQLVQALAERLSAMY